MHGGVARCLVLCVLGSCFTPVFSDHPKCGPEGACPVGLQCLREVCVSTSCELALEGDACANADVGNGLCRRGSCVAQRCGDGILGYDAAGRPELCDDGNQVDGDGCSADCMSKETCGNGMVDAAAGETCDDGNAVAGDGCSPRCTTELLDWRPVTPEPLGPRIAAAVAFDARRGRVVLFGGVASVLGTATPVAETWEYDGAIWSSVATPPGPPGLVNAPMVFDVARSRTVLLDTSSSTTWEYDGARWRRSPVAPQPITARASMAYDARRHRAVVFDGAGLLWEYDGSFWYSVAVQDPPPVPSGPTAIAYDDTRGQIELLDGDALWEYDGFHWQARATTGLPALGSRFALVFDAARDRLVLLVFTSANLQSTAAVYELIGTSWTLHPTSLDPGARDSAAVVYDARRHVTVVFGGTSVPGTQALADTWEYDGTDWHLSPRAQDLAPLSSGVAAFDPDHGAAVLVDGGDTWQMDGRRWYLRPAAGAPDTCSGDLIVFDARRHRVVAFGGCAGGVAQTSVFDGAAWTPLATAHAPVPGASLAMSYDAARDRIVLYDGARRETWLFDGSDWAQLPVPGPGSRYGHVMTFDPERGTTVLFSGTRDTEEGRFTVSDTWEFDGVQWDHRAPAHAPPPRYGPGMTYDTQRHRVVLFGGGPRNPADGRGALADTWEYDGDDWTPRATVTLPPPRFGPVQLVYDSLRRRLMALGRDTWTFAFVSDGPAELCIAGFDSDGDGLSGCADPDCSALCTACGDQVCNELVERAVCPLDCGL